MTLEKSVIDTIGARASRGNGSKSLERRSFMTGAGILGLGAAAAAFLPGTPVRAQQPGSGPDNLSGDTAQQIFTAALIAEDLATTFYLNGLINSVITDPNLAGPGGTATQVSPGGNEPNVAYIQAALSEEIAHANLLRTLIGGSGPSTDPVQNFYFPPATFECIQSFTTVLNALENAFIGAYLLATIEFAQMAADTRLGSGSYVDNNGNPYSARELEYFAQVAASIMGIEAEHRVLGRVISDMNPANNLNYQQLDGLSTVYNGGSSAVVALTPFLGPGDGLSPYSFVGAIVTAPNVQIATSGAPPAPPTYPS